jgi:Xaa-Pro aminopeptidase
VTAVRAPPTYAAFPGAEHRERLDRARRALANAGFDGAVVVAPEHLYYLAGYDSWVSVNSPQVLIFGTDDDEPRSSCATSICRWRWRPAGSRTSAPITCICRTCRR